MNASTALVREFWVRSTRCLGREYGPFGSVAECRRFMRQTDQSWTATIYSKFGDGKPKPNDAPCLDEPVGPPEGVPSGVVELIGEGIPEFARDLEPLSVHDIDLDEWPACDVCAGDGSMADGSRCVGCGGVGVRQSVSGSWESVR